MAGNRGREADGGKRRAGNAGREYDAGLKKMTIHPNPELMGLAHDDKTNRPGPGRLAKIVLAHSFCMPARPTAITGSLIVLGEDDLG
jgi:hypothetical protein